MNKQLIIDFAENHPDLLREVLKDADVIDALAALGVQLTTYELHAPSPTARTTTGLGQTLCGDKARRHPTLVTCKKCIKKIQ